MSVRGDLLNGKEIVLNRTDNEELEHTQMCSFWQNELENICSSWHSDTCGGNNSVAESLRQKYRKVMPI